MLIKKAIPLKKKSKSTSNNITTCMLVNYVKKKAIPLKKKSKSTSNNITTCLRVNTVILKYIMDTIVFILTEIKPAKL
jgi:hypothetical protein